MHTLASPSVELEWCCQNCACARYDLFQCIALPCTAEAAYAVREFVTHTLHQWQHAPLTDEAVAVASELTTNALLHGETYDEIHVRSYIANNAFWFEVHDRTETAPLARTLATDPSADESGRGLMLVAALTTDWGWRKTTDGKTVWAQWELPR